MNFEGVTIYDEPRIISVGSRVANAAIYNYQESLTLKSLAFSWIEPLISYVIYKQVASSTLHLSNHNGDPNQLYSLQSQYNTLQELKAKLANNDLGYNSIDKLIKSNEYRFISKPVVYQWC